MKAPSGPHSTATQVQPTQSATMKFSLIAAVVVLALAQGSFAQDAPNMDLESITQYFEELKTKMTKELTTFMENQDLANQAQTFLEDKKTQLEPLVTQFQAQIKSAATTVEEQIQPLAANVQTQIQPLIDNFQNQMQELMKKIKDQTLAIAN
ncbi:type-4 ice-structuring protein LS-12-like [Gouania willdenowi]|uniref:Type-4 ice-structuring protein LS-12-like n=1 Tax=Gouania willdenowi TaxID=441366 RepID=A0A8C5EU60_GOUWI|nr:type-4 ice-structuring protein LS-12-like [Gouania willdenowi]